MRQIKARKAIFFHSQHMVRRALIASLCLLCSVSSSLPFPAGPGSEGDLTRQFYQQHQGTLVWSGDAKADAHARQALAVLSRSAGEGLDPESYRAWRTGDDPRTNDRSITRAVLAYMRDVSIGRPELRAIDADIGLPSQSPDFSGILEKALRQDRLTEMLDGLAPKHAGYLALKTVLLRSADKADIVAANMERWRWLPPALEPDRVVVNAADGQLVLWLGGRISLTSRVIVGRPSSPTPILRAEGAAITVNPPWTVPHSIAAKEILPKLQRNPAWLANHDMVLLNGPPADPRGLAVDWKAIRPGTFPYQIRQYPGPHNPLGRIKLELPNKFNVYLHDTPDKALFEKSKRQLSHGCVRVEQILPLASYTLAADLSATDKITKAIETGETATISLKKRIPVYFVYWTAVPAADGSLKYYPDVYGRDRRLIAAMRNKQVRIAGIDPACMKG